MRTRTLGKLGQVSALTLGGGGLGQVWGNTSRDEAVATVREAISSGIDFIDVAPGYGDGEAERVVGEAFSGTLPEGVRVSTKCGIGNPDAGDVRGQLERSLDDSLERMWLPSVDLFFLHSQLVERDDQCAGWQTPVSLFAEAVRPALEDLVQRGRIGAWGITAVGIPDAVLSSLRGDPAPAVAQCVTNLLDSPGGLLRPEDRELDPRPREIVSTAGDHGVGVMGIRAVQAGALTSGFDRELPDDHPDAVDFRRAEPFREMAGELGGSPAFLAHRYALSMPGVDTVVLGVKNRAELRECLEAEAAGPLETELMEAIDTRVGARR